MQKDYYKMLGIERNASKDDIKKAFRKLAHKYHPDHSGGDDAKFKEINEAYQVLSDDEKRSRYDQFGTADFGGGGGPSAGWDFGGAEDIFSGFSAQGGPASGFDFADIFSDFFGGNTRAGRSRGRDISIDLEIPFAESVFGTERRVLLTKNTVCDTCRGSGGKPGVGMKTCPTCQGKKKIREVRRSFVGTFTTERICNECQGRGEVPKEICSNCRGSGIVKKTEEITVRIPSGIENGEMIRLSGQGEAARGGVSGDLYIKIHVEPHSTFRRDGGNLLMDLPVKLSDALLGAEYKVKTLDGEIVLKIPEGIAPGETLRVRGRGVPSSSGSKRGDLLITVNIKMPPKLGKQARKIIEDLRKEGL